MKLKKLNIKGFSHVELFVLVVAVVAISSVGYYVAKNRNTSHAGSWQLLASQSTATVTGNVYACVQKVSSTSWIVKGLATITPKVKSTAGYSAVLDNTLSSISGVSFQFGKWSSSDSATTHFTVKPTKSNMISGSITVPKATHGGGGMSYAAGSLSPC